MNTNKVLAGILAIGILATWLWVASADFGEFKGFWKAHKIELTEEQKTEIENMTDEEKKDFFETKRTEKKAERESRENVIDKLLAWETLTSEEEELRAEIIEHRAEMKIKRENREADRAEMKSIMEKKRAWEDLTDEEQAKLDEMKESRKDWKRSGKKGWKRSHR